MRYMIQVRANAMSESGEPPEPRLMAAMAEFHEQLARAGALLDANGLQPSAKGWRIRYRGGQGTVTDGPFAETKEMIAGYTIIEVKSREEALEWTRRFPSPFGEFDGEIEVRQMHELDDFPPDRAVDRFRDLGVGHGHAAV